MKSGNSKRKGASLPLLAAAASLLLVAVLTSVAYVAIVGTAFQAETASQRHQQAPLTANSDEVVTAIRSKSSNAPAACQKRAQAAAEAVLAECPGLPGYCPRPPHLKGLRSSDYLTPRTMHPHMAWQKQFVDRFVYGVGLKERVEQLQQLPDKQGILISAGTALHVGNAAITLHALRRLYNSTLPVEIAYNGDREVDAVTRRTLSDSFAPLYWLDLASKPYPAHHNRYYKLESYENKIYALYHSRFQQVFLLDADNLPLRDPRYLFNSPHAMRHGIMTWLDLWSPSLAHTFFIGNDRLYFLLGVDKEGFWTMRSAGQGYVHRGGETGSMVFDRVRHADVLEYLWWYNSFSSLVYPLTLGDKDAFAFAFALAGKLHDLHYVAVPPGAAFSKEAESWNFRAMVQYDHFGQPTFMHRTSPKYADVVGPPPKIDAISGPLPNRFIHSFLGNHTVMWSDNVPLHAMRAVHINSLPAPTSRYTAGATHTSASQHTEGSSYANTASDTGSMIGGCPLNVWLDYQQAQALGLPLSQQPQLEAACLGVSALLQQLAPHTAVSADRQQQHTGGDGGYVDAHITITTKSASSNNIGRELLTVSNAAKVKDSQSSEQQPRQARFSRALQADLRDVTTLGDSNSDQSPPTQSSSADCADRHGSFWPSVDASTWLAACRAQRRRMADNSSSIKKQNSSQDNQQQQEGSDPDVLLGLPDCEDMNWHVAKFMLHEYAEALVADPGGEIAYDYDGQQPLLALSGGGLPVSFIDEVNDVTIPSGRAWVQQHLGQLPLLRAAHEKAQAKAAAVAAAGA